MSVLGPLRTQFCIGCYPQVDDAGDRQESGGSGSLFGEIVKRLLPTQTWDVRRTLERVGRVLTRTECFKTLLEFYVDQTSAKLLKSVTMSLVN